MSEEKKKNSCSCGHDHGADCDCGCDMDEGIITLVDEEGNDVPFYHIATLEREGKEYACLQKADDEDPIVEIFELEDGETDDEDEMINLLPIDDELYESLYEQLEKEISEMSDDCCDSECECHHHDDK